jgi:Uma2 family endonuclease
MKAVLSLPRRTTYADYLATEQNSECRNELINGVIVATPGSSDEHNSIATRFTTLFGMRVPRGCRSYNSDQRFWIAGTTRAPSREQP